MGWKEDKARYEESKKETDKIASEFLSQGMGFGSSGGRLPKFIKEVSEGLPKLPPNKFDSDFIRNVDAVCTPAINAAAVVNLLGHAMRSGANTDHLRGIPQKEIAKHLVDQLKKYRFEIYGPVKALLAKEGGE
jgi:UDP-glucose 6-dehydrogenase